MKKLDYFWLSNEEWWYWDENMNRVIKPDAPPEAQESYKRYLEQIKSKAV